MCEYDLVCVCVCVSIDVRLFMFVISLGQMLCCRSYSISNNH